MCAKLRSKTFVILLCTFLICGGNADLVNNINIRTFPTIIELYI